MYVICHVIVGCPLPRSVDQTIEEHISGPEDDDLDAEGYGFTTLYSGSDHDPVGYIGVELGQFAECDTVSVVNNELIVRFNSRRTKVPLTATLEQHEAAAAKIAKLPEELRNLLPDFGVHFIWSTS